MRQFINLTHLILSWDHMVSMSDFFFLVSCIQFYYNTMMSIFCRCKVYGHTACKNMWTATRLKTKQLDWPNSWVKQKLCNKLIQGGGGINLQYITLSTIEPNYNIWNRGQQVFYNNSWSVIGRLVYITIMQISERITTECINVIEWVVLVGVLYKREVERKTIRALN